LPGENIGRYKIIGRVGQADTSKVYKALQPELNRHVALKVLPHTPLRSPKALERFEQAAQALAALRHPNIVQVFDLGVADDVHFLAMEYIAGETLSQRLTRLRRYDKSLSLRQTLRLVITVGRALHYAHEQGIVHGNLNPDSIMLRDDGQIILIGFGADDEPGAPASAYVAPEQRPSGAREHPTPLHSAGQAAAMSMRWG